MRANGIIASLKFLFAFILLSLFVFFISIRYLDSLFIQSVALMSLMIIFIVVIGLKGLCSLLKSMFPMLITLYLIYVLFGLTGLKMGQNYIGSSIVFWTLFATNRIMLLLSTLIFIQLLQSVLTMADIFALPFSIKRKKYLILGKALYQRTIQYASEMHLLLDTLPLYQGSSSRFKLVYQKKLAFLLCLIIFALKEAQDLGEQIDNRIMHCFERI